MPAEGEIFEEWQLKTIDELRIMLATDLLWLLYHKRSK
jgi:hypothetical protein